jgi:hypothetical protein
MGILLVVLILFLLFLNSEIFKKPKSIGCVEPFSEEAYPVGFGNSFNSNSRSNDYFYDRTGMKGTLFSKLSPVDIYEPIKKEIVPILSQLEVSHKLETYPEAFYQNCESDFIQSKLSNPVYKKDYINDYLNFDQGILIRQSCGIPKNQCGKSRLH